MNDLGVAVQAHQQRYDAEVVILAIFPLMHLRDSGSGCRFWRKRGVNLGRIYDGPGRHVPHPLLLQVEITVAKIFSPTGDETCRRLGFSATGIPNQSPNFVQPPG